jgi:hypothetical protein
MQASYKKASADAIKHKDDRNFIDIHHLFETAPLRLRVYFSQVEHPWLRGEKYSVQRTWVDRGLGAHINSTWPWDIPGRASTVVAPLAKAALLEWKLNRYVCKLFTPSSEPAPDARFQRHIQTGASYISTRKITVNGFNFQSKEEKTGKWATAFHATLEPGGTRVTGEIRQFVIVRVNIFDVPVNDPNVACVCHKQPNGQPSKVCPVDAFKLPECIYKQHAILPLARVQLFTHQTNAHISKNRPGSAQSPFPLINKDCDEQPGTSDDVIFFPVRRMQEAVLILPWNSAQNAYQMAVSIPFPTI